MTQIASVLFVVAALFVLFVLPARRRARMTPDQRSIADLQRKTRKLEREQDRHRYD